MVTVTKMVAHQLVFFKNHSLVKLSIHEFSKFYVNSGMNGDSLNIQDYQLLIDRGWRRLDRRRRRFFFEIISFFLKKWNIFIQTGNEQNLLSSVYN